MDYETIIATKFIIVLIFITVISLALILFLEIKNGEKIKKSMHLLTNELTNEKVMDYINFINTVRTPNIQNYYNFLISGYKLVNEDENISIELKTELRKNLLRKGILI